MRILKEFSIIFFCLLLGSLTTSIIDFPIPDTVYGMIYLFIAFSLKLVKIEDVETVSQGLIDNLQFFLIPPSVSIINYFHLIQKDLIKIILLVFISMVITMGVTGTVVSLVQKVMHNE